MKKRIKLYTHTDLDGYGCSILLKIFLSANYDIEVTYLDYSDIKNTDFKKDIEKYEYIFITDLNCSDYLLENLEKTEHNKKIFFIDHHLINSDTRDSLRNNFNVKVYCDTPESATYYLYIYLMKLNSENKLKIENYTNNKKNIISEFIHGVSAYDTWFWKQSECPLGTRNTAENLNILFNFLTPSEFEEEIISNLKASVLFTSKNLATLDTIKKIKENYIIKKLKEVSLHSEGSIRCFAYVEAEQYGNELADILLYPEKYETLIKEVGFYEKYNSLISFPDIPLVIIKNSNYLSFRSKSDWALKTAKKFEGGGHAQASGAPIPYLYTQKFPNLILRILKGDYKIRDGQIYYEEMVK